MVFPACYSTWHFFFAAFVCCHVVVPFCGFFFFKAIFQFSKFFQIFRGFGVSLPSVPFFFSSAVRTLFLFFVGPSSFLVYLCAASVFLPLHPWSLQERAWFWQPIAVSIHSVQLLHFQSPFSFVVRSPFCVCCAMSHPSVHVD